MSVPQPTEDLGDQVERTQLAWRRTALSMVVAGALVGNLASDTAGRLPVAVALVGLAVMVAFAWLVPGRRVAAATLSLVLGVFLLGGIELLSLSLR